MELLIETGDVPMRRSHPVKRLSEGELAELRTQLVLAGGPPRPRVDPALDGRACCVGGVRAEAQWDVAHLLLLLGLCCSQRAPSASSGGRSWASSAIASRGPACRSTRVKVQSIVEWAMQPSCTEVLRFTGLANDYRRFVGGYAEIAAPLTALGSPTARFVWTPEAQASFDALKRALSTSPVLRTFDPHRRAVLTTDASGVAVAAILTQPDDDGQQHQVAYESRKLTAAERNYPAHVLELLAVVHALQVIKHYLFGCGAPRPLGCGSDFDLRTDNRAVTWLKTSRHSNKMYVRRLDEIEDFRFNVTHLPGSRDPADPLTRRGFAGADGPGPAASTGDPDTESLQVGPRRCTGGAAAVHHVPLAGAGLGPGKGGPARG
jgi:hypothetical protein